MFITEELTPAETLSELLNIKGLSHADTKRFRTLKHDRNLCPGFREKVATMLDAYKSHRTDVQDTQGPRDEGIDVHLYYEHDGIHRVGLQIKSFDEIQAWASKQDQAFVMKLKAQISAALNKVGVEDYYILLCTDEAVHSRQIRTLASELAEYENVKIVRPRQALAFYELDDDKISVIVTQLLCSRDSILHDAQVAAANMKPDTAYVQLALMGLAFQGTVNVDDEALSDFYDEWIEITNGKHDGDRIAEILGELEGEGFEFGSDGPGKLNINEFPTSWCALYFDQKHRHGGDPTAKLALLLDII